MTKGNAMNDSTDRRAEARVILVGNLGLKQRLDPFLHRIEALDPPTNREAVKPLQAASLTEFRIGDLLKQATDAIDTLEDAVDRPCGEGPARLNVADAYDKLRFAWPILHRHAAQGDREGGRTADCLAELELAIIAAEGQVTSQSEGALALAQVRMLASCHREAVSAVQHQAVYWLAKGRAERVVLAAHVRKDFGERAMPLSMSPDEVARLLVDDNLTAGDPSDQASWNNGTAKPIRTTFILAAYIRLKD
jgi:hypothetical protein